VIGDNRNYLTCLIMIDHDNVVKFAQDHNVPFTNYASLCRAQEVQELIGREVEAVNKKFARVETVKKFRLIDQLLTAEDEELTPTMKLKRGLVEKKYGELIKDMYASAA
jgi:long-chain acyl-CoA synthetase